MKSSVSVVSTAVSDKKSFSSKTIWVEKETQVEARNADVAAIFIVLDISLKIIINFISALSGFWGFGVLGF